MPQIYNDPAGGSASTIGPQTRTDYYHKKALIEAAKEQYFGQLADVRSMPKNMGKKIKQFHYLPLLDDANINDQGLDAAGLAVNQRVSIPVTTVDGSVPVGSPFVEQSVGTTRYVIGEGITAAAAADAAIIAFNLWAEEAVAGGGLGLTLVGATEDLKFFDAINQTDGLAYALGYRFTGLDDAADSAALIVLGDALAVPESGNLYGSSKDIGFIAGKIPALSEVGGRVNRVGFKRVELEGTIEKFGFFDEYTQESLDFDSDSELLMHITRESVMGANEITEDALQIDLLNGAGVIRYAGNATSTATIHGEAANTSVASYEDLMRLSIDLDNNRTPKKTKIITGSRMVDTKTIDAARYMYIGSELIPSIKRMQDLFSNQAFIPVQQYGAAGGSLARGEIGSVDQFRIIVVPEMLHWAGAGAAVTTNSGYRETGGNYDVFPMLVVGDGSFTTIGFQTDGKSVKFKIKHKKPNETHDRTDPYGEVGFYSIKWYYGTMILRPERIALIKCVAEF